MFFKLLFITYIKQNKPIEFILTKMDSFYSTITSFKFVDILETLTKNIDIKVLISNFISYYSV